MAATFQVTFDAADPPALGAFWCAVLGYVAQPPPDGFDDWDAALDAWGVPLEDRDSRHALVDPEGIGPQIWIQKVPEPKTAKNRVHLDVNVSAGIADDAARRAAIRSEAERLASLGATVTEELEELGAFWVVLQDPEGNEFCLQ
jgi:hypothetical protein